MTSTQPPSPPLDLDRIATIVGTHQVVPWDQIEITLQKRFAQSVTPDTQLEAVAYPETPEQLSALVAYAQEHRIPLLPCGNCSKLHWGGLAQGTTLAISTARLNRLIEHAVGDLTVTVEAGMKFDDLQATLAQANQFLALDPAYSDQATIGGILATADTGTLRHRYRGVRDMVLGISFVRADGQLAKAGGRVGKNVAGYDLMKLFTGSYGTLGILNQVTLRTYPIPETSGTVLLTGESNKIHQATQTLLASALTPVTVDLLSPQLLQTLNSAGNPESLLGLAVRFHSLGESVKQQSQTLLDVGKTLELQGNLIENEAEFWQGSQEFWQADNPEKIVCKIGVLPTAAVETLVQAKAPGKIHAGSGLGILQLQADIAVETLERLRQWCAAQGGFLSVLEAPRELKDNIEVWGFSSNAENLMKRIRQKFDPNSLFSPQRLL
ncbi:MAG: FAD-binding oxidoreductase [Microcoleaceae cyanobacterium]